MEWHNRGQPHMQLPNTWQPHMEWPNKREHYVTRPNRRQPHIQLPSRSLPHIQMSPTCCLTWKISIYRRTKYLPYVNVTLFRCQHKTLSMYTKQIKQTSTNINNYQYNFYNLTSYINSYTITTQVNLAVLQLPFK